MSTPNLQLPEVPEAIEGASDEINEGFWTLDAILQLAVRDKDATSPPADAVQGDRFIVPASGATGAFKNRGKAVAWLGPSGWRFYRPRPGWRARILDEAEWYLYNGTAWEIDSGGAGGGGGSPLTTKGDLYTHNGTTVAREAVGPDGTVYIADSSQSTGHRWANVAVAPASGARVFRSTAQSIASGVLTPVQWEAETFDTDTYWSSGNNTRMTAPTDAKYQVGASVEWDSDTAGRRSLFVVKNGVIATRLAGAANAAADGLTQHLSTELDLEAGDYVEFFVLQNSGGVRSLGATEQITHAWIERAGLTQIPRHPRGASWDRRGGEIQTPATDVPIQIPKASVIRAVTVLTRGGPGNCVIDIWKSSYASFPPTAANSICGASKPMIAAGHKHTDDVLTGWTTTLNAGDVLVFHIESATIFRFIGVQLHIEETG